MKSLLLHVLFLVTSLILTSACSVNTQPSQQNNATPSSSDEFMVMVTRPNTLHLIDLGQHRVIRKCQLPGGPAPGTVVMSPNNTIAYVLADHFGDVYGINIDNCNIVFSTQQSSGNVRVKSMASIALSPDGNELYTHQNRVKLMYDHYELLEPQVAVFDTSQGLKAKAVRRYNAPRQITIMDTLDSGDVLLGGPDVYRMDINTGSYNVILPSRSLNDPAYAQRDVLTVWPLGSINNEFIRLYSTAKYKGEPGDLNNADWLWGYERVDLTTAATESREFGPLETVLFTGARRPGHLDKVYATLNHLKEFDIASQTELRSIDLEHTYYCINFSTDGAKIYLSGALDTVAVYDAESLKKITTIQLSGDGSMANSVVFKR